VLTVSLAECIYGDESSKVSSVTKDAAIGRQNKHTISSEDSTYDIQLSLLKHYHAKTVLITDQV
jgi:hypothetical protein